jgi:hypothetical protein
MTDQAERNGKIHAQLKQVRALIEKSDVTLRAVQEIQCKLNVALLAAKNKLSAAKSNLVQIGDVQGQHQAPDRDYLETRPSS